MRVNVFLFFIFITIGLCLWLIPAATEAYPTQRNNNRRCPHTCNIYCPCGHILSANHCPTCNCRPSNACTGRHPNAFGWPPFSKTDILY